MAATSGKQMAMVANTKPELEYKEIEIPKPGPGQVLVKISYVAQNPTDQQSFDAGAFGDDAVHGCDFVGEVVELGQHVSKFVKGDVVAGLIWGGEIKRLGAYAEYTLAEEKIAFKVPDGIDHAAASTIPLAVTTAWLALFSKDCLNIPRDHEEGVLIWGGSSSVGQYAVQIAHLFGFNVITTCSPRNFELAKRLGASLVFDYSAKDISNNIREEAPGLKYVFDTIGNKSSSTLGCMAAGSNATMCTVRPGKANTENVPEDVKKTDVLVWTAFLKDHAFGEFKWPANKEDHELAVELYDNLPKWIEEGKIKPNDVKLLKGLKSLPEGYQLNRDGKLSAQKIVYQV